MIYAYDMENCILSMYQKRSKQYHCKWHKIFYILYRSFKIWMSAWTMYCIESDIFISMGSYFRHFTTDIVPLLASDILLNTWCSILTSFLITIYYVDLIDPCNHTFSQCYLPIKICLSILQLLYYVNQKSRSHGYTVYILCLMFDSILHCLAFLVYMHLRWLQRIRSSL